MDRANSETSAAEPLPQSQHDELLMRVGQLTRSLHDSLRELGLDKILQRVATDDIPTARDRLLYVAKLTEQAAQRVLNATDAAGPLQEQIEQGAIKLAGEWKAKLASTAANEPAHDLMLRTLAYLETAGESAADTRKHLMDIMMAQDFQDLTGQVIKKVTELGHSMEAQMVQLLIDYAPNDGRREAASSLLNGPQINPNGNTEVVADQEQVDDLLESLGF